MSIDEKMAALIREVLTGTREGKITWQITPNDEGFFLDLGTARLFLVREPSYHVDLEVDGWVYKARLHNANGQLLTEVEERRFPGETSPLDSLQLPDLHAEAKRSAFQTDKLLDDLLANLKRQLQTQ